MATFIRIKKQPMNQEPLRTKRRENSKQLSIGQTRKNICLFFLSLSLSLYAVKKMYNYLSRQWNISDLIISWQPTPYQRICKKNDCLAGLHKIGKCSRFNIRCLFSGLRSGWKIILSNSNIRYLAPFTVLKIFVINIYTITGSLYWKLKIDTGTYSKMAFVKRQENTTLTVLQTFWQGQIEPVLTYARNSITAQL